MQMYLVTKTYSSSWRDVSEDSGKKGAPTRLNWQGDRNRKFMDLTQIDGDYVFSPLAGLQNHILL